MELICDRLYANRRVSWQGTLKQVEVAPASTWQLGDKGGFLLTVEMPSTHATETRNPFLASLQGGETVEVFAGPWFGAEVVELNPGSTWGFEAVLLGNSRKAQVRLLKAL